MHLTSWKDTTSDEGLRLRLLIAGVPFVASHAKCAGILVRILVIQFICNNIPETAAHKEQIGVNFMTSFQVPFFTSKDWVLVEFRKSFQSDLLSIKVYQDGMEKNTQTFLRPPAIAGEPLDPCAKELRGYLYKPFER